MSIRRTDASPTQEMPLRGQAALVRRTPNGQLAHVFKSQNQRRCFETALALPSPETAPKWPKQEKASESNVSGMLQDRHVLTASCLPVTPGTSTCPLFFLTVCQRLKTQHRIGQLGTIDS